MERPYDNRKKIKHIYNYQVYADSFDDLEISAKIMSGTTATKVLRGVNGGMRNMYNTNKTPSHLEERLKYYKKALEVINQELS